MPSSLSFDIPFLKIGAFPFQSIVNFMEEEKEVKKGKVRKKEMETEKFEKKENGSRIFFQK